MINEGKEVKLIKNGKHMELEGSVLKYYYNEKSQAYIAKIRLIFLKPDIYYWYKEDENYLSNNSNLLSHGFGATLDRKKIRPTISIRLDLKSQDKIAFKVEKVTLYFNRL